MKKLASGQFSGKVSVFKFMVSTIRNRKVLFESGYVWTRRPVMSGKIILLFI